MDKVSDSKHSKPKNEKKKKAGTHSSNLILCKIFRQSPLSKVGKVGFRADSSPCFAFL